MGTTKAFATLLSLDGDVNQNRTIYTNATIPNQENNLADWLIGLEIQNTGTSKVNNGEITLRIDEQGTFIRNDPILINEDSKNDFYIELQLKQDIDNDGDFNDPEEQGIILRGIIGNPTIIQNSSYGEILRIPLSGLQYKLKETLTSEWYLFKNPNDAFKDRVEEVNLQTNSLNVDLVTNTLPISPLLSYRPRGPTSVHDAMNEIIDALSNPQVDGGAFDDYYYDIEPDPVFANHIDVKAEKFGETDSGVVIDPLSLNVEDTGEENTLVTDNIQYKNHVIMIGDTKSGSLPMERARFGSNYLHARIRDEWNSGITYQSGDLVKVITSTPSNLKPYLITYHRSLTDSNTGNNPLTTHGTNWEIDFTDIPPYITTSGAYYKKGEIVSLTSGGNITFYQANVDGTHSTPPSGNWNSITSISDTDYEPFVSYSPWTNDVDIWKQTLAGRSPFPVVGGPSNSAPIIWNFQNAGWAWDWNVTKSDYNRKNLDSHFEHISPKVITGFTSQLGITSESGVPADQKYDGNRFLIDSASSAPWSNNINKLVEYDAATGSWIYSDDPVHGDVVVSLFDARIYKYDSGSGLWETKWDHNLPDNTDKPSPFHLCQDVGLVAGATNIAGQAVEFKYDWYVTELNPEGNLTHHNRTSRGVWICSTAILPRHDTNQYDKGELYGGTLTGAKIRGTLDTNNYDRNSKGLVGWNRGIDDEDYGRISSMSFKMRVGFYKNPAGTSLVQGIPDIPMTFWAIDKFDRVWFHKFKLRRNGQWDDVTIPIGELAPSNLYHARWDELAVIMDGVPLTELDFTIKEREFSGVAFDWRYMKYWGVQLDESYTDVGLYKNGVQRAFEFGEDIIADLQANWYWYLGGPLTLALKNELAKHIGDGTPVTQNHVRYSAKIAIDDLHFDKELVVTSDDTTITNPRSEVQYLASEQDYVNLKTRAKARQARQRFFPQTAHIRTTGDVRLRFGEAFKVSGSRVPENPNNYPDWSINESYIIGDKVDYLGYTYQALTNNTNQIPLNSPNDWENLNKYVASNVTHKFNHDGYYCEVAGFRKFVVSG